jgi:hypothetical protein
LTFFVLSSLMFQDSQSEFSFLFKNEKFSNFLTIKLNLNFFILFKK